MPHSPPHVLERRMDDHAVLARRAQTEVVARMHEDLSRLYRERLVEAMRRLIQG